MKIAIMDFSSTALSLLVAEVSREHIEPMIGLRRSVSLIDFMSKKGKLSARGIEKIIEAVRYLEDAAKKVGSDRIVLIATASMRLVSNYSEIQEAVYQSTGLSFDILNGKEEAYADAEANREYASLGDALLLDIGGATAELADLDEEDMENMFSLPIGPVALRSFSSSLCPDEDEAREMRRKIRKVLSRELVYPGAQFGHIVLVGGNCEALYSVYSDFYRIPDSALRVMKRKKLKRLISYLVSSEEGTSLLMKNAPEKAYLLIPSAVLAYSVAKFYDADELIISGKGVKEGYLRLLMEEING